MPTLFLPISLFRILVHTLLLLICGVIFYYLDGESKIVALVFLGWIFYFWLKFYIRLWRLLADMPYIVLNKHGLLIHQYHQSFKVHLSHEQIKWVDILYAYTIKNKHNEIKKLHIIIRHGDDSEKITLSIATKHFELAQKKLTKKQRQNLLYQYQKRILQHCLNENVPPMPTLNLQHLPNPKTWRFYPWADWLFFGLLNLASLPLLIAISMSYWKNTPLSWQDWASNLGTHTLVGLVMLFLTGALIFAYLYFLLEIVLPTRLTLSQRGLTIHKNTPFLQSTHFDWAQIHDTQIQLVRGSGRLQYILEVDILPHPRSRIVFTYHLAQTGSLGKYKLDEMVSIIQLVTVDKYDWKPHYLRVSYVE
ncbi:hypothetical protein MIS46_00120 [Wielerella bovis]|uniref:hypothetical protein n=1 Tax=Wielerella bovis TaxID=2917790 RepID=UPI002018F271|nr:hypothetical protein [Wielerella bovis]ULJ62547.1 hypothetical protein MIS46_00120 [Wielerella bovis]